ncbi:MAG TPA: NrfD/PsrC family molybdoenzyme membrane anchor subunit [Anaeromyxobacteraceae bacterium]|nr:NrfD/PsrC family molybdoenzyme membrane anchor subunit [Anaeromyxobacteraceae bacterium]
MTEIDIARHSHLIDPQLHVWGWEIPVYLFLGGMAAGVMILSALLERRGGERSPAARALPFLAPALVSAGMLALFLDLSHKLYVWRFYLAFRWTSPMSWGAWILLVVYPVTLLQGLASIDDAQATWIGERLLKVDASDRLASRVAGVRRWALARAASIRTAAIAAGVGLGVYTGILLSALGARALWGSALLGPLFLVSGLSTGAAAMMLLPVTDEERHALARWDLAAIGVEVALLALVLVGLSTGGADARAAAALLLGGGFTAPFWALVVVAGLAVPASLEILELRLPTRASAVAPALVLVGGLALRWILVAAGQG